MQAQMVHYQLTGTVRLRTPDSSVGKWCYQREVVDSASDVGHQYLVADIVPALCYAPLPLLTQAINDASASSTH